MELNLDNSMKIMKKDWKMIKRNKQISIPMFIMPIIFTIIMPILTLIGVLYVPEEYINSFGGEDYLRATLNVPESYNRYLFAADISAKILILPYFLFIPSMITIVISSDSFAGEKERKTMESLALLPITKKELILGKVLAGFIPSMIISLIFFVIQGIIINIMFIEHLEGHIFIFLDLTWLFTIFFLTPAVAFFNILVGVFISSRSKDFKSAQSIAGSLIIPVLVIMFMQLFNLAFLSPLMILVFSGILGVLSLLLIHYGSKLLDIERLILML